MFLQKSTISFKENPLASGSVVLKEDEDKSFSVQIEQLMLVPPCVETVAEEEPNKPRQVCYLYPTNGCLLISITLRNYFKL